jgi:hypothetical protein
MTGSLRVSNAITASEFKATSSIVSPNITWSSTLGTNGGEIRISQTQFRGGNNITYVFSQTTDSNGTRDLGIRRNNTGSLEIYDGNTADGALANRRDLLLRNITGSNALFSGSVIVTDRISGSFASNNPSSSLVLINGSIQPSASLGGASAMYVNTLLSASANNQTLVGLDIAPTFTNGAFTGVSNYGIRTTANIKLDTNNTGIFGSNQNTNINFAGSLDLTGSSGIIFRVSNSTKCTLYSTGNLTLQNGGTFTDAGFRLDVSGSTRLNGNTQVTGSLGVTGSITTTGTITAQTLVVQTVSSSIIYSSGSNIFGNDLANTQVLTGSVNITGSLAVNGSNVILSNQTSSMSASYALNATSASFATNALTASYVANASSFPFTGSAIITGSLVVTGSVNSTLGFTGSLLGTATTASYALQAVSASYATFATTASSAPGYTVSFTQSVAAATWSFVHNMNTRYPIVQVYGSDYKQIIPNDIIGVDVNTAEIRFDYATTGYVIMSNGGGLYVTGSTSLLNQTSAATTWSFTHNLNSKYVNFEVYDSNDYVIIPAGIRAIDVNTAELHFAGATAGKAVANFSGINGAPNATTASYALTSEWIGLNGNPISASSSTAVSSSTSVVSSTATGSYYAAFFDYAATSGSNSRAGTVMSVWNAGTASYNEVTTNDIGNTSQVTMSVDLSGANVRLKATTTTQWTIRSLVRLV